MEPQLVMFGYAADNVSAATQTRFTHFSNMLGKRSKHLVELFCPGSYEELMTAAASGYVDVAWLAPLPFLDLQRRGAVVPLVHLHRGGSSSYRSVIIVRADSRFRSLEDLRGSRAAWGDRFSASGFVVPRAALARKGLDPRVAFGEHRMCRSHESVIRSVAMGRVDFGATYAGVDEKGSITRGAFLSTPDLRVLAVLDEIPGDVVVASSRLSPDVRDTMLGALLDISREKRSRLLGNDAFGVDEFQAFSPQGYDEFEKLAARAAADGLLEVHANAAHTGKFVPSS